LKVPDFEVGDAVEILIEYGNKEMPIIIGHAKKVVQEFMEDEINVLVSTLEAFSITENSAYLEGRVEEIEGYENVTRRGFYYGTSTDYGSDVYSTGSFAAGSYNKQVTDLSANTTYHFQAYVYDADGDKHTGEDKTFITTEVLISCDYDSDTIYIHDGITSTILDSFASPTGTPTGLTYDGSNLISCDWGTSTIHPLIYIHSGISSTITDSFNAPNDYPDGASGLAYDNTNLISCSQNNLRIYIHSGITVTTTSDFASPSTAPSGLTYDGANLISCNYDYDYDTIYKHSGITSTITDSFANPLFPRGLTYDGINLISCDATDDTIYKHSGITSTITDSFASPSTSPQGLAFSN